MEHNHNVTDTDPYFSIDPDTRVLSYESEEKLTIIQGDHNSEIFTFEIPRTVDGHDMLLCDVVRVHYINIDASNSSNKSPGVYKVVDLRQHPEDEELVLCSWAVSSRATKYAGSLNFLVQFACSNGSGGLSYSWNTAIYSGVQVTTGMNNSDIVVEDHADVLEQWYTELLGASAEGLLSIEEAKEEAMEVINSAKSTILSDMRNELGSYGGILIGDTKPTSPDFILWFDTTNNQLCKITTFDPEAFDYEPIVHLEGDLSYITQELGDKDNLVISQKVITEYINRLVTRVTNLETDHISDSLLIERINKVETDVINYRVDFTNSFEEFTDSINDRVSAVENTYTDLQSQIDNNSTILSNFFDVNVPLSSVINRLTNIENKYITEIIFDQFKADYFSMMSSFDRHIVSLQNDKVDKESIGAIVDRIDANKRDLEADRNRIIQSESTIVNHTNQINNADARLDGYDDRISKNETDISDHNRRLTSLEISLPDINGKTLLERVQEQSSKIDDFNATVIGFGNRLNEFDNRISSIETSIAWHESGLNAHTSTINEHTASIAELQNKTGGLPHLNEGFDIHETKINDLIARVAALEAKHAS